MKRSLTKVVKTDKVKLSNNRKRLLEQLSDVDDRLKKAKKKAAALPDRLASQKLDRVIAQTTVTQPTLRSSGASGMASQVISSRATI